jgi:hypothetical protein
VPFSTVVLEMLTVVEVAPGMELKVDPESVETSHWTVGVGEPAAAALNEAVWPATTLVLDGFASTAGAPVTVSSAAVVVAVPAELENTASYWFPLSASVVANV